jgi:hypothetical protein
MWMNMYCTSDETVYRYFLQGSEPTSIVHGILFENPMF